MVNIVHSSVLSCLRSTPNTRIAMPTQASTISGRAKVQFISARHHPVPASLVVAATAAVMMLHHRGHAGIEEAGEAGRIDAHPQRQHDQRREHRPLARAEVQDVAQIVAW